MLAGIRGSLLLGRSGFLVMLRPTGLAPRAPQASAIQLSTWEGPSRRAGVWFSRSRLRGEVPRRALDTTVAKARGLCSLLARPAEPRRVPCMPGPWRGSQPVRSVAGLGDIMLNTFRGVLMKAGVAEPFVE